jgi:hypothetical protein
MPRRSRPRLVLGRDYVLDERGRAIFTRDYLLSMGACCGNGCLNCPYPTCASREPVSTDGADTAPVRAADAGGFVPRR